MGFIWWSAYIFGFGLRLGQRRTNGKWTGTKLCVLCESMTQAKTEEKIKVSWATENVATRYVLYQRKNAKRKALEIWKCHTPHSQHSPKAETCDLSFTLAALTISVSGRRSCAATNNKNIEMRWHAVCLDGARINLLKIKLMWTKSNKTNHTLRLCPIAIIIMANQKRTLSRIPSRNHSHRHYI